MATGAGKTYAAVTLSYRLVKWGGLQPHPVPRRPQQPCRPDTRGSSATTPPPGMGGGSPSCTTWSSSPAPGWWPRPRLSTAGRRGRPWFGTSAVPRSLNTSLSLALGVRPLLPGRSIIIAVTTCSPRSHGRDIIHHCLPGVPGSNYPVVRPNLRKEGTGRAVSVSVPEYVGRRTASAPRARTAHLRNAAAGDNQQRRAGQPMSAARFAVHGREPRRSRSHPPASRWVGRTSGESLHLSIVVPPDLEYWMG